MRNIKVEKNRTLDSLITSNCFAVFNKKIPQVTKLSNLNQPFWTCCINRTMPADTRVDFKWCSLVDVKLPKLKFLGFTNLTQFFWGGVHLAHLEVTRKMCATDRVLVKFAVVLFEKKNVALWTPLYRASIRIDRPSPSKARKTFQFNKFAIDW